MRRPEALDYLQTGGKASLIVLDIFMPRLDGRLLRAKLSEDAGLAGIPVLVFSVDAGETPPDVVGVVHKADPEGLLRFIEERAQGRGE